MAHDLRIASPCTADWNLMTGDDRVRHCEQCNLNVYNFAELTRIEIEQLVTAREGRLCARLYKRADGTLITKDCPIGFQMKVRRISRIAGAALAGAMVIPAMAQRSPSGQQTRPLTAQQAADVQMVVTDPSGAVIPNASVRLTSSKTRGKDERTTDLRGRAEFAGLSAGTYKIEIASKGFRTFTESITVSAGESVSLETSLLLGSSGGVMVFEGSSTASQDAAAPALVDVSVIDPTGAAIPNAKVTLTNQATHSQFKESSGPEGIARFLGVPPATYTVQVESPGFTAAKEANLKITSGHALGIELQLRLGGTVLVGDVAILDTDPPTTSSDISGYPLQRSQPRQTWFQKVRSKLHL